MKSFHVLILKAIYLLLSTLDVSRSKYITLTKVLGKDNVKLWGISEQIEAISDRIDNGYADYSYSEEFRCYIHKDTIIK